ncbi:FMN reductase [Sphaerisporangium krabiense]|uniref:NAD(P)H-dependent FMN reductase n=1 Tax=Sphaerisporangium krabiense TaxID=763782 RepID=A0A7W8Z282_9ACTN|nr:NAD(P)H-dependent oxidoreductase [Sphaerisporangium krabiense]MBB5626101.1 NAD(P)H-dependent FMN reductase [Sphaerisporangium krabiense]GII64905.1 FMN reductase [Sphaerisporangium krabiense]
MTRIAIIVGSTRPGRIGRGVADWVYRITAKRTEAEYEIVDLADQDLPLYDEAVPAAVGRYAGEHTRRWAEIVERYDGYLVVTPEYNHAPPAALKNAFDFVYAEWGDKAIGFVGYGAAGGARAVEHLKLVAVELSIAPVSAQVGLLIPADFPAYPEFTPLDGRESELERVLNQLESWSKALAAVRA